MIFGADKRTQPARDVRHVLHEGATCLGTHAWERAGRGHTPFDLPMRYYRDLRARRPTRKGYKVIAAVDCARGVALAILLGAGSGLSSGLWQAIETVGANQAGMDLQGGCFRLQHIIDPVQKTLIACQHLLARISYRSQIEMWHR